MTATMLGLLVLVATLWLVIAHQTFVFLRPWFKGVASGVPLSIVDVLGMHLRGVPPGLIINAHIMTVKAGCPIPLPNLEAHHLAGGHAEVVARAVVKAHQNGLNVGFDKIFAIDLAGKDVLRAVEEQDDLDAMLDRVDLAKELSPEEYAQLICIRDWLQSHRHCASILAFLTRGVHKRII